MTETHEQFAERLVRNNEVGEFLRLLQQKGADLEIFEPEPIETPKFDSERNFVRGQD